MGGGASQNILHVVNNGIVGGGGTSNGAARHESLFTVEDEKYDRSIAIQLILLDEIAKKALMDFAIAENIDHYILFFESALDLQEAQHFEKDLAKVMELYINPNSKNEIKLSSNLKKLFFDAAERKIPIDGWKNILVPAIHEVSEMIFQRFKQSKSYELWNQYELEETGIKQADGATSEILVIDDSLPVVKIISRALYQHGFSVDIARDGIEALAKIQEKTYTAVLVDFQLPFMGGAEVISRYREIEKAEFGWNINRKKRIIIGMSVNQYQDVENCGMDAFLKKPFTIDVFLSLLHNLNMQNSIAVILSLRSTRRLSNRYF